MRDWRGVVWVWLGLTVAVAGVRFSDGSVLLAIARGAPLDDPVLADPAAQYLWDSPLKVGLLKALPASPVVIGLAFTVLALLPLVWLAGRSSRARWLAGAALLLTPAWKLCVQNVGLGDGLVVALMLWIAIRDAPAISAAGLVLLGLWHPQQAFFIGTSQLVAKRCFVGKIERAEVVAVASSLAVVAASFFAFRRVLGVTYSGRFDYLLQHLGDFQGRSAYLAAVAFAPIVVWLILLGPRPARSAWLLLGWLVVLMGVSWLTADVTRVLTLVSLPIVLTAAGELQSRSNGLPERRIAGVAVLVLVIPLYSWSGLEYALWGDLAADLCNWHVYCW